MQHLIYFTQAFVPHVLPSQQFRVTEHQPPQRHEVSVHRTPPREEAWASAGGALAAAVYSAEKFLRENGENIPQSHKDAIEAQLGKARTALESGDSAAMTAEADKLKQVMSEAGAAMYQQQAAASGAAPGGDGSADDNGANGARDEDVIEGEFSDA